MSTASSTVDMKRSVRLYPIYRTKLGEAIFPGDNVFTLELRGFFNEMLAVHFEEGGLPGVEAFGASLAKFTPRSIDEAPVEWKDTVLKRWIHEQRPFLAQSMYDYLVLGGYQARVEVQTALLDERCWLRAWKSRECSNCVRIPGQKRHRFRFNSAGRSDSNPPPIPIRIRHLSNS